MRKYFVGGMVGLILGFTVSTHAEEVQNLIGQAVQGTFPVKVENTQLESPAIVVDNKTYLPVRSFGESIGYEVTFDAELGVKLTKKTVGESVYSPEPTQPTTTPTTPSKPEMTAEQKTQRLQEIDQAIEQNKTNIKVNLDFLELIKKEDNSPAKIEQLQRANRGIESRIAELEKQKSEISK